VEALRVSIGMEAYAQRDPLVQYKSQASEMFKTLLSDIRTGVIAHVFTYQTRRNAPAQIEREAAPTSQPVEQIPQKEDGGGGKAEKRSASGTNAVRCFSARN
jgi:preprotein translocase subunit SecA